MSIYRQAAKVDNNQTEIVKNLRKLGYTVEVGHDDILVGYQGLTYWYEIKNEDAISKKTGTGQVRPSEIKPSQRDLLDKWKGHYKIVWTVEQIINDIKNHKKIS